MLGAERAEVAMAWWARVGGLKEESRTWRVRGVGKGLDEVGMVWTIWKEAAAEEEEEVEVAEARAVRKWSRRAEGGDERGERIIKPHGFE